MASLLTGPITTMRPVDAETTARVLAQALGASARMELQADGDGIELSCTGTLVGADESHLFVDVGPADVVLLCSAVIHAAIEIDGAPYAFDTRCADDFAEIEPGVIRVVRPATIATADRRRSPRCLFRGVTEITLFPADESHESPVRAALLNLSPHGLACRAGNSDAGSLSLEAILGVAFSLGPSARTFHLNGRVVSVTKGGTRESLVVGLEFIDDERLAACRERLHKALEAID